MNLAAASDGLPINQNNWYWHWAIPSHPWWKSNDAAGTAETTPAASAGEISYVCNVCDSLSVSQLDCVTQF